MRSLRCLAILVCLRLFASSFAAEQRTPPPYTLTEVWSPIPPAVATPTGGIPSDAIVLFDGKNLDAWEPAWPGGHPWKIEDGAMVIVPTPAPNPPCDQQTKRAFGDVQLHLEFRLPADARGEGQNRSNTGVFFMGLYEVQILDSYASTTYVNGQNASVYKEHAPLVNASRPAGEWQTFDAVFVAPRFSASGTLLSPARLTVLHNGVLVQHDVVLTGPTPNGPTFNQPALPPYAAHAPKLPLLLQDHRNTASFRNIWIRELFLPESK